MSEEKAKVVNNVTMENGEVIDFGEKGKCFISYDLDTSTVTAKVVTGQIISLNVAELPDSIKEEMLLWGAGRKLATSILSVDGADVADRISVECTKLQNGKFTSRGMGGGSVELDDFQVAWALVNATGVVNSGITSFPIPEMFLSFDTLKPEWVDINNPKVIEDILHTWDAMPAKEKTAQRKSNDYVRMQARFIESGAVEI